jgi:FkbM family methyltransferase
VATLGRLKSRIVALPGVGSRVQAGVDAVNVRRYQSRNPGVEIVRNLRPVGSPPTYSQYAQDRFLFDRFFRGREDIDGVFLDVGANDPVLCSNTYMFEKHLGWTGVAVEPLPEYGPAWAAQRSTPLVSAAAAESPGVLKLNVVVDSAADVPKADMLSSVVGASEKGAALGHTQIDVPARTLTEILQEHGVDHVNLMSLDVEGFELPALRGLDFSAVTVDVVLVENDTPALFGDRRIQDHLEAHGFSKVARIWRRDDVYARRGF